jgi:hypothetical protein
VTDMMMVDRDTVRATRQKLASAARTGEVIEIIQRMLDIRRHYSGGQMQEPVAGHFAASLLPCPARQPY